MKGMILAAGFGTRLRPLTYLVPKPVVPLCNRPLITYAVDAFLRAGIDEIIVNLHHLPEAIEDLLRARYGTSVRFHFSREEEILGTGGALRRVRPLLEEGSEFLLVNGDTIQFPDYDRLVAARRAVDAVASLTLRHPPPGDRFTPVFLDDGRVTGFGQGSGEALMFSGAHCISTRLCQSLPDRDFSGIVDDGYRPLLESGRERVAGIVDDGLWFDIGTPTRYRNASTTLLEATVRGQLEPAPGSRVSGDSLIEDSARVTGTCIASTVGASSVVSGSLRDTIICRDDPRIPRDEACRFEDGLVLMPFPSARP